MHKILLKAKTLSNNTNLYEYQSVIMIGEVNKWLRILKYLGVEITRSALYHSEFSTAPWRELNNPKWCWAIWPVTWGHADTLARCWSYQHSSLCFVLESRQRESRLRGWVFTRLSSAPKHPCLTLWFRTVWMQRKPLTPVTYQPSILQAVTVSRQREGWH